MERTETKISQNLLEEVRRRAAEERRSESEVIEDAVSRYLEDSKSRWEKAGSITGLLEEMREWRRERGVPELSEEEAMKLANEELGKLRRGE